MLSLTVLLQLGSCEENPEDVCLDCPVITGVNPNHGSGGEIIVITGTNFSGFISELDQVTINGKNAVLVEAVTNTELKVQVPVNAGSGPVIVHLGGLRSAPVREANFVYNFTETRVADYNDRKTAEGVTVGNAFFRTVSSDNAVQFANETVKLVAVSEKSPETVATANRINTGYDRMIAYGEKFADALLAYQSGTYLYVKSSAGENSAVEMIRSNLNGSFIEKNNVPFRKRSKATINRGLGMGNQPPRIAGKYPWAPTGFEEQLSVAATWTIDETP
ncbi:IPT/TIG domain-containing protein [Fulvivirgaceae bacterium BMA12]|uniref:IPT/TIG domain-containing protein n=1 Tax=Agaribacillus aureus TaxID=3051825 RepID=A0ABT8LB75_9BACT|nr:IPT/TIG domain-containing protein [Fulvivirgaceae bacterium BMA12]